MKTVWDENTVCAADPVEPGLYAVEIFYGWKLLEWDGRAWWFEKKTAPWNAGHPAQWLGPLPPLKTRPQPKPVSRAAIEPEKRGEETQFPDEPLEDWEAQFADAPTPAGQVFDL